MNVKKAQENCLQNQASSRHRHITIDKEKVPILIPELAAGAETTLFTAQRAADKKESILLWLLLMC